MKEFTYKYSIRGVTFYYFEDRAAAARFAEAHPGSHNYGTTVEIHT